MDSTPRPQDTPAGTGYPPMPDESRDPLTTPRAASLLATLQRTLPPVAFAQVVRLAGEVEDACNNRWTARQDWLIEGVAQHCGPFAPAIRALAYHVEGHGTAGLECRHGCQRGYPGWAPAPTAAEEPS